MNVLINRCFLPKLKNNVYQVSLGNLFLDNFKINKIYNISNKKKYSKKIYQTHLIGYLGDLVIITDKKTVIEGYYLCKNIDIRFFCLEDQYKLSEIFPKIELPPSPKLELKFS